MARYRATVAHQSLGVVWFDASETTGAPPLAGGGEGLSYPGAGTLVVRAPADHRVHGGYGDSANDTAIVWDGDCHERYAGHIGDDVVTSFVLAGATVPVVRVLVASSVSKTEP